MQHQYAEIAELCDANWLRWNPQWVLLDSDPLLRQLLPIPFSGRQLAAFLLCPVAYELMEWFGRAGELDAQKLADCFSSGADGMCKLAMEDAYSHLARAGSSAGARDSTLFEVAQRLAVDCEDKRDAARLRLGIASVSEHGLSDAEYSERINQANDEVASLKCEVAAARKRAETEELDWLRRMVLALYRQGSDWQADATSTDAFLQRLQPDQAGDGAGLDGVPNELRDWWNAPREKPPQEYQDSFALWCEIDAIDRQIRELEITRPVSVTEILASRVALKELHAERARLLAEMERSEPPLPPTEPVPACFDAPPAPATDTAPPAHVVASDSNAPAPNFSMLATREQLIEAFGRFTGMDASWFNNIKDTPALQSARKITGQGGRGHIAEPWFCPFEVMQWVASPKRRKNASRKLNIEKAWELLEKNFPKVYSLHSVADPRPED